MPSQSFSQSSMTTLQETFSRGITTELQSAWISNEDSTAEVDRGKLYGQQNNCSFFFCRCGQIFKITFVRVKANSYLLSLDEKRKGSWGTAETSWPEAIITGKREQDGNRGWSSLGVKEGRLSETTLVEGEVWFSQYLYKNPARPFFPIIDASKPTWDIYSREGDSGQQGPEQKVI
jgi:hypothetical protein